MLIEVLLRFQNVPGIEKIDIYKQKGGYQALGKAVRMNPEEVVRIISESGLRGRGGAGYPTAKKWELVLSQERKPHYFVCNVAEGEPGSFKDRALLKNPHQVLEAVAISAYAIGAEKAFIYLRGAFVEEEQILRQALLQARAHRLLGNHGLLPVEIVIHRGVDSYIAGEETALLESLEGKPAIPRTKPPRPHEYGLWDSPTVVNNVETICNVISILLQGPAAFRKIGTAQSPGTKLFCLSGQIQKPGLYEVPLGISLSHLLNECGGGPIKDRNFFAVFPGGPSTPLVPYHMDPSMDFESLEAIGSHLGTGGVIVLDDSADLCKVASDTAAFFAREACGACPPCMYGTAGLHALFQQLQQNHAKKDSFSKIRELAEMMKTRGQCAHCRAAALTATSLLPYIQ